MASRGRIIFEKLRALAIVSTGGFTTFSALNIYNENEKYYENFIVPLMHKVSPETAHNLTIKALKYGLIPKSKFVDPPSLVTGVWNLTFHNPVGIAAGFDKQGDAIQGLFDIGFGIVEVGSVTPLPQPGNEKPRVFRLAVDEAIINRYGFNSEGHEAVYKRILEFKAKSKSRGCLGVNLGKNKTSESLISDYVLGVQKFGEVADYLVINVSSPNTPGLRNWQSKSNLKQLLQEVVTTRNNLAFLPHPPLLLKLSADLSYDECKDIVEVINDPKCKVDGLIISNTSIQRPATLNGDHVEETGGLSGKPIANMSTSLIKTFYKLTKGKVPIVGVGGISSGQDAYEKIKAGASLVQIYSTLVYHGPPVVTKIKRELDECLRRDGFKSVAEAVGKDAR
nr:PREDICTED: dihydroorotate dehydrogenase (quinone), mitochondrial [Bemisia tabaci]